MQKQIKEENKVISVRLPILAIQIIEDLMDQVRSIQKKQQKYNRVEKQQIIANCIYYGAPILEKKLEEELKK